MNTYWIQRTNADTDTWMREIDLNTNCYVSQYADSKRYYWQVRYDNRYLSGIAEGREAAMAAADEALALPVDKFNARILHKLFKNLREIERDIALISPTAEFLPGYHAGYEDGVADMKRRITEAINGKEITA